MPYDTTTDAQNRGEQAARSGVSPASGPVPSNGSSSREWAEPGRRAGSSPEASTGRAALTLGRLLFGGYFVYNGINHFQNREMMAGYAASKGVPSPDLAVQASGAMILLGGLSLMTGVQPRAGASLIAGFLLGVTPVMHAFWNAQTDGERMSEMVNFTKNVGLLGGAAFAAALPEPWPGSPAAALSARRAHR